MAQADYLYLEDLRPGATIELGTCTVSEEEIIAFARAYDPQPFHIDPAAAAATPFGGIIASGWHTCALTMRLMVDNLLLRSASLGSPGIEQLRWTKPVRPGDTLSARVTVLEVRASQSRPDRGTVKIRTEVHNQHGEQVMWMENLGLFACRPAAAPG